MINFHAVLRWLTLAGLVGALSACGGGGGGGNGDGGGSNPATTPSTTTFPIAAAVVNQIVNGFQIRVTITGKTSDGISITGTGTFEHSPAVAGHFEGQAGMVSTQSLAARLNANEATIPVNSAENIYYDSNYIQVGGIDSEGEYTIITTSYALPTAAHVNDSGTLGSTRSYADKTKITVTGTTTSSYTIDADSATSVIFHITTKSFDTNNTLDNTTQELYRVDTLGHISFVSADLSTADHDALHVVPQ